MENEDIEYFFMNGTLWILPPDSDVPKPVSTDNPLYAMVLELENKDGNLNEYLKESDVKN